MLDIYRNAEELHKNSTPKQIKLDGDNVFSFLKNMEHRLQGEKKADAIIHR